MDHMDQPEQDQPKRRPKASKFLKKYALPVIAGGVAVIGVPVVIGVLGFKQGGIAARSVASGLMSSTAIANGGGVPSKSVVSILQSVGAKGLSTEAKAVLGTGVAVATAGVQKLGRFLSSLGETEDDEEANDEKRKKSDAATRTKDAQTQTEDDDQTDGSDFINDSEADCGNGDARGMTEQASYKQQEMTKWINGSELEYKSKATQRLCNAHSGPTKNAETQTENTRTRQ